MTCAVHILANTIFTSLLLQFSFCFDSLGQGRRYILEFLFFCTQIYDFVFRFGRHAIDLAPCHRFGSSATDLVAVPQTWSPCYRFGRHATDLATMPQIWPPCHKLGRLATDSAAMPQIWLAAVPQIWHSYHRFGTDLNVIQRIWLVLQIWQGHKRINNKDRWKIWLLYQHCISVLQVIRMLQEGKGINHAYGVLRAGSQILFIAHIFYKFQTIKTLRRYSEI